MTTEKPHPWDIFLQARADAIDWMRERFKRTDEEIAKALSMDAEQVFVIRTRNRTDVGD